MIAAWKARRYERQYRRGYDYAAGQLLTYRMDPAGLARIEMEASNPFGDRGPFEDGMIAAIASFTFMTKGLHCIYTRYGWVKP